MVDAANIGDWVQIHEVILEPGERAPHLPDDTKAVPLQQWVKGYAKTYAKIGEGIEVVTVTGRLAIGELTEVNPGYSHDFGEFIPELMHVGSQLRELLADGEEK